MAMDGWRARTACSATRIIYLWVIEVFPAIFELEDRDRIPVRAICHVMDVSDIKHPREVAQYEVPEGGSHNFWAANDMLYEGYYSGARACLIFPANSAAISTARGREIARFLDRRCQRFSSELTVHVGRATMLCNVR